MNNPEKLATLGTQDTEWKRIHVNLKVSPNNVREYRRGNQNWTIQRNWQHRVHKTQNDDEYTWTWRYHQINVREYRRGNQKWTIQRNWQNRVHKTQNEDEYTWNWRYHQINVREYRRGNQKWTIQRNWQHSVVQLLFQEVQFSPIVITLLLHGKTVIVIRKLCFLDNNVMMMQRYYTTLYTGEYCLRTFRYDLKQIICCLRNNSCKHILLGFLFDIYVFINMS